jgi:hypothetical protein
MSPVSTSYVERANKIRARVYKLTVPVRSCRLLAERRHRYAGRLPHAFCCVTCSEIAELVGATDHRNEPLPMQALGRFGR